MLANRGGSKTFDVAVLHFLNATYKPGCECLTVGATEAQGSRCYGKIEEWCYERDSQTGRRSSIVLPFIRDKPKKSETVWKTGSKVEIVAGTESAVSGPHCHPGSELILTFDGYKRIDELDPETDRLASYFNSNDILTWGTIHGKIIKGETSKYSGVCWNSNIKKWVAQVNDEVCGRKEIGKFDDEIEAHQAICNYRKINVKQAFPFIVSSRFYKGDIIKIESEGSCTEVTPNHYIRVKINKELKEKFVVYLMNKGSWWRVGKTKGGSIVNRISEEKGDRIWILKVFDTLPECLQYEQFIQAKYGLTGVCFKKGAHNNSIIDPCLVHESLDEYSDDRSIKLLKDFNMRLDCPLFSRTERGGKRSFLYHGWIDTISANVIPLSGLFKVPKAPQKFIESFKTQKSNQAIATASIKKFWGNVYSLEILPYHYYVANGIVVHNSAKCHADEVDQMDDGTWNQLQGVAVTNPATGQLPEFMSRFNGMIPPQDFATSTRNSLKGKMHELLKEVEEDKKNGDIPAYDVYPWCIWETIAQVPNCRGANPVERANACAAAGLEPDSLCDCDRIPKGKMPDGTSRTLEKICGGKAFKSRGWKPYIDLARTFKRNTPGTWTLQHECREGQDEHNYIQDWSLSNYGIRFYEPNPLYGPIYMGVDWGTSNPASVLWFQYLTCEVPAYDFEFDPIWLYPGSYVLFKEIYVSGLDTPSLAKRVISIENDFRTQYGNNWNVRGRFCDPQGLGDRVTFNSFGLKSYWPVKTRNKGQMIETVQNLVLDDRFAVDVDMAPAFCEEIESWQKNPKTDKELDKHNHAMSAWRYGISNAEVIEAKRRYDKDKQKENKSKYRMVEVAHRMPTHREADSFRAGSVAARGGSSVPLDPQFQLTHRR